MKTLLVALTLAPLLIGKLANAEAFLLNPNQIKLVQKTGYCQLLDLTKSDSTRGVLCNTPSVSTCQGNTAALALAVSEKSDLLLDSSSCALKNTDRHDMNQVLKTCTITSTDPVNDAKYTVNIVSMETASFISGDFWHTPISVAIVYYSGPLMFHGQVQDVHVTHQVGVYSISSGGPQTPPGTDYYAGVTAGTVFELALNFQPGQSVVVPGTGRLSFTDDVGDRIVLSSGPVSAGSYPFTFSCK